MPRKRPGGRAHGLRREDGGFNEAGAMPRKRRGNGSITFALDGGFNEAGAMPRKRLRGVAGARRTALIRFNEAGAMPRKRLLCRKY